MHVPQVTYRFTSVTTSRVVFETNDAEDAKEFCEGLAPAFIPRDQVYLETLEDGEVTNATIFYRHKNALN